METHYVPVLPTLLNAEEYTPLKICNMYCYTSHINITHK